MVNGEAILAAVLSLHEATERGFSRVEAELGGLAGRVGALESRLGALETRFDRFEVKVLERFDALDARLIAVESR